MTITNGFFTTRCVVLCLLIVDFTLANSALGLQNQAPSAQNSGEKQPDEVLGILCPKWLVAINGNVYIYTATVCNKQNEACTQTDHTSLLVFSGSAVTGCSVDPMTSDCKCNELTTGNGPYDDPNRPRSASTNQGNIDVASTDPFVICAYPDATIVTGFFQNAFVKAQLAEETAYYRIIRFQVTRKGELNPFVKDKNLAIRLTDTPTNVLPRVASVDGGVLTHGRFDYHIVNPVVHD